MDDSIFRLYSPGCYQTVSGQLKRVKPLSIVERTLFFNKVLPSLGKRLKELNQIRLDNNLEDKTFTFFFDTDPIVQELTKECLSLNGVNIEDISIDQAYEFLIEHKNDIGWLVRINQPIQVSDSDLIEELQEIDPREKLAGIVSALSMITDNVLDALQLTTDLPSDLLENIIKERNKINEENMREDVSGNAVLKNSRIKTGMTQKQENELLNDWYKYQDFDFDHAKVTPINS